MDLMTFLRAERDRVAAGVLVLLGLIALVAGYVGVANSAYVADQLTYIISGGLGGLFLLGGGATLFLMADLRDDWAKLDRIELAIRESGVIGVTGEASAAGTLPGDPEDGTRIGVEAPVTVAVAEEPPTETIEPVARPVRRKRPTAAVAAPPMMTSRAPAVGFATGQEEDGRRLAAAALSGRPLAGPATGAPPRRQQAAGTGAVLRTSATISGGGMLLALVVGVLAEQHAASVAQVQPAIDATSVAAFAVVLAAVSAAAGLLFFQRTVSLRSTRLLARWDTAPRHRPWATFFATPRAASLSGYADPAVPARSVVGSRPAGGDGPRAALVTGPSLRRVHRAGCPIAAGVVGLHAVELSQLAPGTPTCGICGSAVAA